MILEGKKIAFTQIDITADACAKERMRQLANNPSALAPHLANGDSYCGVWTIYFCLIIIIYLFQESR